MRFAKLLALLGVLFLQLAGARAGGLNATYDSATYVPVTTSGNYDATGITVNFTLNFAPPVGTNLTVVKLTGLGTINGTFSNLAQNQAVALSYLGQTYTFVANYFGGSGNDLVLQWVNARAMAWGYNVSGQLGNNSTTTTNLPVSVSTSAVLSGKTTIAMSAGEIHSLALCSDGTLAAWGSNSSFQIGENGGSQSNVPVLVSSLGALASRKIIAIAAGANHNLALCSDGTVATWGANGAGQLGKGNTSGTTVPVSVGGLLSGKRVVAIAAGQNHSVAVCSDNTMYAWGSNSRGQLGNGAQLNTISTVPVAVSKAGILSTKTVYAVAAGQSHCLALCSDGTLAAWGENQDGQLGNEPVGANSNVPVAVLTTGTVLATKTVTAIACGGFHSLALCSDGTLAAWGQNFYGQLGTVSGSHYQPSPVATSGTALANKTVTAISGGLWHSLAQCSDGTLTAWGKNVAGELGTGNYSLSPTAVAVSTSPLSGGERFTAAFSGANAIHTLAIVASPAPPPACNLTTGTLISNGSFESGFTNWITSDISSPYQALVVRTNGSSPGYGLFSTAATDATHSATSGFDGAGPGKVRIAHELTVTSTEPFIRFDYRAGWDMLVTATNSTQARTFAVTIEPSGGGTALQSTVFLTAAAQTRTLDTGALSGAVDLSAYIGTTVRVSFDLTIPENRTGPAFFQLDNVRTAALLPPSVVPFLATGTLISNGSFESNFTNWSISDLNGVFSPLLVVTNGYTPSGGYGLFNSTATDGTHSATSGFGGNGPSVVRLAHKVTVTAAEPYVRFDYRAGWNMLDYPNSTLPRTFSVNIEPDGGGPVLQSAVMLTAAAHTKNLDTGAQTGAVDLSAYIGTTVRVCFDLTVPESALGPAFFQLDNVRTAGLLPATPNPITRAATASTIEGATLNAIVNANGLNTTVEFEYGPTTGYGSVITDAQSPYTGNTNTAASVTVSGLIANRAYHYRVKTTNSAGTKYGADAIFITLPNAPTIADFSKGSLTNSSTMLLATVEPNGASTAVTFEYGTTTNFGSSTPAWEGPVTALHSFVNGQISGLAGGTTYYWRVNAENAGGIAYSDPVGTYTPDPAQPDDPATGTLVPTKVNRSSAQLNGTVNAHGSGIAVDFQFGTTTNYSSTTGASPSTVSGSTDTAITATRNSLSPGTTYHYRARAHGPHGDVYGPDVTFTTPAIGFPAASTDKATNIMQTTALLGGYASGNNGPATTMAFEYGTDTNYGSTVTVPGFAGSNSFTLVHAQIPVSGDSVTYHYRIRAKNNIGTTYGQDMTFTTPDPHEARLYDLSFSSGALSQPFDRNVTSYTMSLAFEMMSLWLTPTASTGIGSVTVNGITVTSGTNSGPIALNIGANTIDIIVTALDGTTQQTYRVTITRAVPMAGNLDLSFNSTGMLTADIGGSNDNAYAVAVQGDGKIVAAGSAYNGSDPDFAVARYNPDGTPDTTFGGGTGKVMTDLTGGSDTASSVALQSDGKIVVAGAVGNGTGSDLGLVRYNAGGTLDTTFNGTGKVILPLGAGGAGATSVAVQSDGKIVVAGTSHNGTDNDFALVRYHGDISTGPPGTLDLTFNGTGMVVTPLGGDDIISSMALQGNGRIVVAGASNIGGNVDCVLARYASNGTLDPSFNGTGIVFTSPSGLGEDVFSAVAVQGDGKIVAAGHTYSGGKNAFVVARHASTGAPDTDFNGTGTVITAIGSANDNATCLALQSDGRIVVAGYSQFDSTRTDFAMVRYMGDGSLDTTFHGTGKTTNDLGRSRAYALGVALQGDGKIVAAGYAGYVPDGFSEDFAVVRYLGDGPAIAVQVSSGPHVFDGISTVQSPGALPGASVSVPFTIQNTGTANLTGLGITIDGTDSSAFTVTASPAAPASPFAGTTFTVRFLPASLGPKTATLHIASNVTGNTQSYDISLNGTGLTTLENWRQQFLGTATNTGDAADNADPYHTGVPNLAVFALLGPNQNPALVTSGQLPQPYFDTSGISPGLSAVGVNYVISFTQPAGVSGVTYGAQWCPDLAIGNWQSVTDTGTGGTHTFSVPIGDNPQIFMRLKVTSP